MTSSKVPSPRLRIEPVRQAVGLRDVQVVEPVAVDVAHRHAVVAHAARREDRVERRRPVVESRHELAAEGRDSARTPPAVTSVKTGAAARLRRWSSARPLGHAPGAVGRRAASASASGPTVRARRRLSRRRRGRSAPTSDDRGLGASRVTSMAVIRNSAVWIDAKSRPAPSAPCGTPRDRGDGGAKVSRARKSRAAGCCRPRLLRLGDQAAALEFRARAARPPRRRAARRVAEDAP